MKIIIEQWETIKTERLHKIEINLKNSLLEDLDY